MIFTKRGLQQFLLFGSVLGDDDNDPELLAAKVFVYVNNINPTAETLAADLDEASWTGYVRSAVVVWGTPVVSSETGLPVIFGDLKDIDCTTQPDPPQTAYGYALVATISAVDVLLAVQPFPTPLQPVNGSSFGIVPRVGLSETAVNPAGDLAYG